MTTRPPLIFENRSIHCIAPARLDALLADGWRHFGTDFFRYSVMLHNGGLCRVLPLRVRLADFAPTKSLRRVARRNADLDVRIRPTVIDEPKQELFLRHSRRFKENTPESIYVFVSKEPDTLPCPNYEVGAYLDDRLLAASFLDVGGKAASSVYAMFDPEFAGRGLGFLTILEEIAFSMRMGCEYYYIGYAYNVQSHYDYKKRLPALEAYDWSGRWMPMTS